MKKAEIRENEKLGSVLIGKITPIVAEFIGSGKNALDQFIEQLVKAEDILNEAEREKFQSFLGPSSLFTFFINEYYLGPEMLSKSEDAGFITETIIRSYLSLPWKYDFFLELPLEKSELLDETITLSDSDSLELVTDNIKSQFVIPSPTDLVEAFMMGASRSKMPRKWKENVYYFHSKIEGYVHRREKCPSIEEFESRVKAFIGLGYATTFFTLDSFSKNSSFSPLISAFQMGDLGSRQIESPQLDDYELAALSRIKIYIHRKEDAAPSLFFVPKETINKNFLTNQIDKIKSAFIQDEAGALLRGAARWLFDGHSGLNEKLRYIQLTTALEMLLGAEFSKDENKKHTHNDKEKIGLASLMANRFAYQLGTSLNERKSYYANFKRLYDTRSRILHDGNSLSLRDRTRLHRLEEYTLRLIESEVEKNHRDKLKDRKAQI